MSNVVEIEGRQGPQGPPLNIPQLPDATTVNATDEFPVWQGGEMKRATPTELLSGVIPQLTSTAQVGANDAIIIHQGGVAKRTTANDVLGTALVDATGVVLDDEFVIRQSGTTKRVTAKEVADSVIPLLPSASTIDKDNDRIVIHQNSEARRLTAGQLFNSITPQLTDATTVNATDEFIIHQGGVAKRATAAELVNNIIPPLPDATTVNDADELIIQQGGVTKRATRNELMTFEATGSTTPRFIADRFADTVNVKDFGAVGDGVTDDWLAIHRAIKSATFASGDSNDTAATLTLSDTQLVGGVQVPRLFVGQGQRTVYFPPGAYYISRPLIVTHGTQLYGEGAPDKSFIYVDPYGEYNAIESFGMYFVREFGLTAPEADVNFQAPDQLSFCANLQIHNLNIRLNPNTKPLFTRSGTTATVTLPFNHNWQIGDVISTTASGTPAPLTFVDTTITGVPAPNQIQFAVVNSGATTGRVYVRNVTRIEEYPAAWYVFPMNQPFARRSSGGAAGSNTITLNKSLFISVGNRVRFSGGNDEYTIASISGATLTMTSNFTRSIAASEILMMGLPAQNGICVNGGENALIAHCYAIEMQGAGIMIYGSSPAPVVLGCMSTQNYVAYWLDGAIGGHFIKPSGDRNYIFFKLGSVKAIASVLVEAMKSEDFGPFPSRCLFQVYADATGSDACLTVLSGHVNSDSAGNDLRSMIEIYSFSVNMVLNFIGFFAGSYGADVIRQYDKKTGILFLRRGRTYPSESTNNLSSGTLLNIEGTIHNTWVDNTASIKTYVRQDSNAMATGGGIIGDSGTFLIPSASFTRAATVLTLTIPSHGLVVGDYVLLVNTQNYSPWISFVTNSAGDPAYFNGCAKVQSIVDADTITITVVDSGPVSGTCEVKVTRYWNFHQIRNGAHVFQMPNQTLPTADKSMVKFISRNSRTQLSGLNVPALDTGEWWAKDQFTMGGTVSAPAVRLLTGAGAPSASAPDGSLYLRTDGTADTTLYVRAAGAWAALTTT